MLVNNQLCIYGKSELLCQNNGCLLYTSLEINPRYHQTEAVAFCREHGILVESWGPLARGGVLEAVSYTHLLDEEDAALAASLTGTAARRDLKLAASLYRGVMSFSTGVHVVFSSSFIRSDFPSARIFNTWSSGISRPRICLLYTSGSGQKIRGKVAYGKNGR